jgi:hypothetical protein
MVLASTAVFGAVRRARGVTEEFEGFPVVGDRLWIKNKNKLLVPQTSIFKNGGQTSCI